MKVLIVEDELNAREYLARILKNLRKELEIVAYLDSVKECLNYLSNPPDLDLIFMDIQLSDGISFEIFNHLEIPTPIIFTTAYDQYAIGAFKVNSIDYLLKPIDSAELEQAISKFEKNHQNSSTAFTKERINALIAQSSVAKKKRCMVRRGNFYEYVDVREIAYIHSRDSITFLFTKNGKRYMYSKTVEALMTELDESTFFQINRSQIVNIEDIAEIHPFLNQRLLVKLRKPLSPDSDLIVSRKKVSSFKNWLDV